MNVKFSKTQLITAIGIAMSIVAAALAALGKTDFTLFFLTLGLVTAIFTVGVIHRYLVETRRATNRQFLKLHELMEEQGEASARIYPESPVSNQSAKKTKQVTKATAQNKVKTSKSSNKNSSALSLATPAGEQISPLESPLLSEYDRRAVVSRAIKKSPKVAGRFALKVKSEKLRDFFALAASGNFYTYTDLIEIVRRCREGNGLELDTIKHWDAECLITLAQVLGNQRLKETDLEDARIILVVVAAAFGKKALSQEDRALLAEIVGECGDWGTAAYVLEQLGLGKSPQYRFTLANQYAGRSGQAHKWLESVNDVYSASGLTTLSLEPSTITHLDQLSSNSNILDDKPFENGPLVSVIVPTYEGADRIETALKSLVAQTWKNLEILVVDDGSSSENVRELERIISTYPSVKLITLGENKGAYAARNEGLRQATGEFVTVHDDDDWSHPQKIRRQVDHYIELGNVAGTISKHVRVTEDLKFTRINRKPFYSQNNMSSLLLRTEDARKLGGWDEVNRGADEEFTLRLQKVTGSKIACCSEVPLSFTRTHDRSLTSGEILRGFQDPSRMFYHSAFTEAHKHVDELHPEVQVAPLPADMSAGNRGADLGNFDFGYVLDTKLDDLSNSIALAELRKMDELGFRVAIIHHHSLEGASKPLVAPSVLQTIADTEIEFLSFKNLAQLEYLIVRDARAFEFGECTPTNLKPKKLAIVPTRSESDVEATSAADELAIAGLSQVFNIAVKDVKVLSDWVGLAPYDRVNPSRWQPKEKVIVGRGAAPTPEQWPSKVSELREVYGSNELYEVALVDDFGPRCERIAEVLRGEARFVSAESYDSSKFLSELDFWVDMGTPHTRVSEEVLSAIAAGTVVVLRTGSEEVYGDSVLFADPNGVKTILRRMRDLPLLYQLQRERGLESLPKLWDYATFEMQLNALRGK